MLHIAINGFGRIGRSFLRAYLSDIHARKKIKIVAINIGPANKDWVAHLFKYDTFMGIFQEEVSYEHNQLHVAGLSITVLHETDPKKIDWGSLNIDWVIDASGQFTQRAKAQEHINAGAKKVLITAFAQNPDVTIGLGINDHVYDKNTHTIVSLASCTANAMYPMVKVLHEAFGIENYIMNTMHSYTNRQVLMDVESTNLRRSRAAAVNIIPTTLQTPSRIQEVYSNFTGTISGQSTRVPIGKVSFLDVAFAKDIAITDKHINDVFIKASKESFTGIIATTTKELVSIDYTNSPYSVTIDESLTSDAGTIGKIFGWYDNESGYSHRLKDFLMKHGS